MFAALGQAVERMGGRYIAAEDVGSSPADMNVMRTFTSHVTGMSVEDGGTGDPSPATAAGCFAGVCATAAAIGRDISGLHVAIQGLGSVGYRLAAQLAAAGARLTVADIDNAAVARAVADLPGVSSAEDVTGPYDVIARIEAASVEELGRVVIAKIQNVPHITRTTTCTVVHFSR